MPSIKIRPIYTELKGSKGPTVNLIDDEDDNHNESIMVMNCPKL
jgi:hypothetical protein